MASVYASIVLAISGNLAKRTQKEKQCGFHEE
jgi:hypothetical protein